MTIIEKRAWFVLAVCLMAIVAVISAYGFLGSFGRAMGGMGVLGLTGVTPLIGLRRQRRGEIVVDERDGAILKTAARIAFAVFWLAVVAAVMGLLAIAGEASTVRVSTIASALVLAWLLISIVHSSSVLWMCRVQRAR